MHPESRRFLAAIVALFLCRSLAAGAIVPPWQGPDEPTHFSLTKLLASPAAAGEAERNALEGKILESMARHGWWAAYQQPTPSPLPRTFREVQGFLGDNVSRGSFLQPAYYVAGAAILRLAPSMDVEAEYHLLRWLSVVLAVATLLCGWAGTRLVFGEAVAGAAVALAALHPQFLLSALTVNPDALINLCGALVWWQAARLHAGAGRPIWTLLIVVAATAIAALSKRNGVPLVLVAVALLGYVAVLAVRRMPRARVIGLAAGGVTAGVVLLAVIWQQLDLAVPQIVGALANSIVLRRSAAQMSLPGAVDFLLTGVDTAWLVAGWLRFPAPDWWMWIARGLTIAGLSGALALLIRRQSARRSLSLAWMFVVLLAGPLLIVAFVLVAVPQGRYLFAAFVPVAALLIVGMQRWFPDSVRHHVAVAVVALVAFLDAAGFATVLVPAYLS